MAAYIGYGTLLKQAMVDDLTKLEFSLEDVVGGQPLTPQNVDLPTLRGFLQDVETLIKGDVPGGSLAGSRVSIEEGSVKVAVLAALFLGDDLRADIAKLGQTGDLDELQPKRGQVIEKWQKQARQSPNRKYSISVAAGISSLKILSSTAFQHKSENAWVSVEKYLTGKVVNAGGKQDPNIHLVLAETGDTIRISATEQQLSAEKDNQLYKEVTLRIQAEQHLKTKAMRNIRLTEFLPQSNEVDEQSLLALWEKGRSAWKNVSSASAWVEALRGNI